MNSWSRFPFVRLIIPLVLGILAAIVFQTNLLVPLSLAIGAFGLYVLLELIVHKKISYRYRWIYGAIVFIILFISGYHITRINTPLYDKDNIAHMNEADYYTVRVIDPVAERPNSFKVLAEVVTVYDSIVWKPASGKVLLYFEKEESVNSIQYGDELIIATSLNDIESPGNVGEFNYRRYLQNKGIYHRGFIQSGDWRITGQGFGHPIKYTGIKLRKIFLEILNERGVSGKEYAVVSAILLGYDEYLDPEQKKEFAGAGAMHILCVSGLHVGIVYVILNNLLIFLNRKRWMRILKVVLLLGMIWFYAAVTGFSPSVMRASTMFSFIIIGRTMQRKADIFNMIAASAFLLLVINPYLIMEVGFQLSYTAVIGIILLFKPIYNLYRPQNYLLDKIWQISVVSIAATLFTLPFTIFYFRQFPMLFLLTNLVAIPASMLIIYLGIGVLITSVVPVVSSVLSWLLVGVIKILSHSVHWIDSLTFSTLQGIYIEPIEFTVLLLMILSLSALVLTRRKSYISVFLVSTLLLASSVFIRKMNQLNQQKIVVYKVRKSTAIDFISGRKSFFVADTGLLNDQGKISYHLSGYRSMSGIKECNLMQPGENCKDFNHFIKTGNVIWFGSEKIVMLSPGSHFHPGGNPYKVNYLIISGNPELNMKEIASVFTPEEIIFDSSNAWYRLEQWKKECEELKLSYHDVSDEGAWIASL